MDTSPSTQPVILSTDPAGFWIRFGGNVIDGILVFSVTFIMCLVLGYPTALDLQSSETGVLSVPGVYNTIILNSVLGALYSASFESSKWQATVGKKVLGLTVADMDGERIGFPRAIFRYIPKALIITLVPIAMVVVALNARKKGIHDFIADTRVFKN